MSYLFEMYLLTVAIGNRNYFRLECFVVLFKPVGDDTLLSNSPMRRGRLNRAKNRY